VELLLSRYPKLNPYRYGVATLRGQGSSIVVQGSAVVRNLELTPSRVKCASTVETAAGKRAAGSTKDHTDGVVTLFPFEGSVVRAPAVAVYESCLAHFPGLLLPPASRYASVQLVAYTKLVVYNTAPEGDPRRQEETKFYGWRPGRTSGRSQVRVSVNNR